jgi:hypothetical protein
MSATEMTATTPQPNKFIFQTPQTIEAMDWTSLNGHPLSKKRKAALGIEKEQPSLI